MHGEGIFIRFDEAAVAAWETEPAVVARMNKLQAGHRGWRNARKLDPADGFPGIRYAMFHTLAHLLIRELALECGYNAASIRERIYADTEGDRYRRYQRARRLFRHITVPPPSVAPVTAARARRAPAH